LTKQELSQLFYLNREIEQLDLQKQTLEDDLRLLKTTTDSVQGSAMQIPFQLHSVKIEGIAISDRKKWLKIKAELSDVKKLKELKSEQLVYEFSRLNRYIQFGEDSLIRQILELRFIKGFKWNKVADDIGGNNTEDSVKKAFYRYLKSEMNINVQICETADKK